MLIRLPMILVAAPAVFAGAVFAQGGAPVKIIIAFPPGGPVDFVARILAQGLGEELAQSVIVENRPGANGAISAQAVAKSAPDGSTLWFTSAGAAVMNPALYDNLTYDVQRDFAPVSLVVNNVEVLVVNPRILRPTSPTSSRSPSRARIQFPLRHRGSAACRIWRWNCWPIRAGPS